MSEENKELFNHEEASEGDDLNLSGHELNSNNSDNNDGIQNQNNQWIDELVVALDKGCDLGTIRNIGKCRSLTDDLRLRVWKVRE